MRTKRNHAKGLYILIGCGLGAAVWIPLVACSSEKPGASSGNVASSSGGASDASSPTREDAGSDSGLLDGGSGDAGADAAAGPCLGDNPASPDGGAADCAANGCTTSCANVEAHYRGGVADFAVRCLAGLPSCADPSNVIACVELARARSCTAAGSAAFCMPRVVACDPQGFAISEQGCESFAQAMTDAGRAVFADCIDTKVDAGTCADEVGECADQIRQ